ncbi:MAG: hydrogenase maturation protease [Desulfofustis sp.]|nr:hydrogenase maturation protease [Desulfofustis sp.]
MDTVILGLGNELLADEGVGVHAVRRLQLEGLPGTVTAVEVGTAVLDALPVFESAGRIIVIDAMRGGGLPGTVYKIQLADCSGSAQIASMHGFDIFRVLALAGRVEAVPTTVFGVEPKTIDWSLDLSPCVTASLPHLLEAVRQESGREINTSISRNQR